MKRKKKKAEEKSESSSKLPLNLHEHIRNYIIIAQPSFVNIRWEEQLHPPRLGGSCTAYKGVAPKGGRYTVELISIVKYSD